MPSEEDANNISVCIPLDEPSLGARHCVHIKDITLGIDWEANRLNLQPTKEIVNKGSSKEDVITPLLMSAYFYDTVHMSCKNCGFVVKENDKYCSNCGQRLK